MPTSRHKDTNTLRYQNIKTLSHQDIKASNIGKLGENGTFLIKRDKTQTDTRRIIIYIKYQCLFFF